MRNIKELSHDVFYDMHKYSQIVIDYVEDAEQYLNADEEDVSSNIGSLAYHVDILLEVINPALEDDVKMLKELQEILDANLKPIIAR
jgi:hypothetical protein